MMQEFWYDIGKALLAQIIDCLGDACEYSTYVSMGKPTADCNSIAFWPDTSISKQTQIQKCNFYRTETARITLTRCCSGVDSQATLDPTREDAEARCFLRDADTIMRCLLCNTDDALKDYRIDCGDDAIIREIIFEESRLGECYTVDFVLQFDRAVSCDCAGV